MKESNEKEKTIKLFQRFCREKFSGEKPPLEWMDWDEGIGVAVAGDKENMYFLNNKGTTIFYSPKENPREIFCFACDSEIVRTKRPIAYNCAEIPKTQRGEINYPHCPKCKPEIPKEFYGFFGEWPGI